MIAMRVESQGIEHAFAVSGADLVAEGPGQLIARPCSAFQESIEGRHAGRDAFDKQLFGVGLHQRLHAAANRFILATVTELVMRRVSAGCNVHQAIVGAADATMRQ